MVKWFRNADDRPHPQVSPVKRMEKPRAPKTLAPKTPKKKDFKGPKSPEAYKKRLYVPKKFVMAADILSPEELESMLPEPSLVAPDPESEPEAKPRSRITGDPIVSGLYTIPDIDSIVYRANPHCCDWCASLNGDRWFSVEEFEADRSRIVKAGDDKHLAHPGCTCWLDVETPDGRYTVNSAGQVSQ